MWEGWGEPLFTEQPLWPDSGVIVSYLTHLIFSLAKLQLVLFSGEAAGPRGKAMCKHLADGIGTSAVRVLGRATADSPCLPSGLRWGRGS